MLAELDAGEPSVVSNGHVAVDREEIRERMSGNLCRCGAYNIRRRRAIRRDRTFEGIGMKPFDYQQAAKVEDAFKHAGRFLAAEPT